MTQKLIVGLGNPGKEYYFTRHNIGFRIIDNWLSNLSLELPECFCQFSLDKKHSSQVVKLNISQNKIILAKPETFMNNSGIAVSSLVNYYNIPTKDILIIHDDLSFPLGKFKADFNSGPAGHNGVKSVIEHLGTKEFNRLRIGISKPIGNCPVNHQGGHNFVLGKFNETEEELIANLFLDTEKLLNFYLTHDFKDVQNNFNNLK